MKRQKKRRGKAALLALLLCGALLLCACGGRAPAAPETGASASQASSLPAPSRAEQLYALSLQFVQYRSDGENAKAMAMMTEELQKAVQGQLSSQWLGLKIELGAFVEPAAWEGMEEDEYYAIELTLVFEQGRQIQRAVFDADNLISGLRYRAGAVAPQMPLPEQVTEQAVTVDAGQGYPLEGLLTLPAAEGPVPAVVLVHGSGPSNRDAAVGANKPFRDIAYLLGQQGIAVLRYDKRSYTYGAQMVAHPDYAKMGVDEETANDAAAAVALLKQRPGIDPNRIFLLGHSMGGGLLSYIAAQGAGVAGYVIMAGTPRQMWELSLEQNERLALEYEAAGNTGMAQQIRSQAAEGAAKAAAAATMNDEEALDPANAAYGVSAWYWRSLARVNALALHLADGKPVLVLQGGKDRQVTETDYALWQEGLAAHPNAEYRLYPELNHLMGHYEGEAVPFAQMVNLEYTVRTPVPEAVAGDVAAWIKAQA